MIANVKVYSDLEREFDLITADSDADLSDPKTQLSIGCYHLFAENDLKKSLPFLSNGDKALANCVTQELEVKPGTRELVGGSVVGVG